MRINIAASHRFHLLDLARELDKLGHEVRFYSYVPTKRATKFGLKKECSFSLFYLMIPLLVLVKIFHRASWTVRLINAVLDLYLSIFMKPCDLYIALGTVYKNSFISAKNRFGATTILEWGSKHNEEQQRILAKIPGIKQQEEYFKKRALDGYELADYIAIPSEHVRRSFEEKGISKKKLIQNPYGVDLSMFSPTELEKGKLYDVIMVGGWSYVKGCDLLINFFRNSDLTLLHVGPIVDLPFPKERNMVHVDAVDQSQLINYYSKARVFVLPSRAEGLAMVQSQALVCGLPIVCSKNTGGTDLKNLLDDPKWIIEIEDFTIIELSKSINKALKLAQTQSGKRSYSDNVKNILTWEAYGKRYGENIKILNN
jgi:glycosyltransferase involved in cell wall biosynthesis